jgi:hypothetical protein
MILEVLLGAILKNRGAYPWLFCFIPFFIQLARMKF